MLFLIAAEKLEPWILFQNSRCWVIILTYQPLENIWFSSRFPNVTLDTGIYDHMDACYAVSELEYFSSTVGP